MHNGAFPSEAAIGGAQPVTHPHSGSVESATRANAVIIQYIGECEHCPVTVIVNYAPARRKTYSAEWVLQATMYEEGGGQNVTSTVHRQCDDMNARQRDGSKLMNPAIVLAPAGIETD